MADPAAFYSYVRADDDHDGGYLTQLRKRLAAEVRMQTGDEFLIFQDRDDILWGQRWQSTINGSIDSTTFLIPILTPAFFRSEACRSEVQKFLLREASLGRSDLILPIYYVDALALADSSDLIASELASRQYADWRPLRFEGLEHSPARAELARLAGQIVAALGRTSRPVVVSDSAIDPDEDDDAPGFVELVAEAEDAFPIFNNVIEEFGAQLEAIGEITNNTTNEFTKADQSAKPASARLVVIGRLASQLEDPAQLMETLADDYVEQLARVDGGVDAMSRRIPHLTEVSEIAAAQEFYVTLQQLAESAEGGMASLETFASQAHDIGRLSRTVRPVFRRIIASVKNITPSKLVIRRWANDFGSALAARDEAK